MSLVLRFVGADTGNKTTCYAQCVEAGSDPSVLAGVAQGDKECIARLNFSFSTPPPAAGEATEVQYLVKWLNWSHLHNTWETEASLNSKDIKGIKKFHNFLKREEEREEWEASASLEDIEYLKCQEELSDQLLVNFTQVERIIGEWAGGRIKGEWAGGRIMGEWVDQIIGEWMGHR